MLEFLIILEVLVELNVNCGKLFKIEIVCFIKMFKLGKVVGLDNIFLEFLKVDFDLLVDIFYGLFGKIWEEEEMF